MHNYKIGFIGCGNIASAIIRGSLNSGYIKSKDLYVFDTDFSKCSEFVSLGSAICESAAELAEKCDFVFLTVKPQVYDIVLQEIKNVKSNVCYVAVAAGITIKHIKNVLGFDAPVIRIMPNTPLMYGEGASALVYQPPVSEEQFSFIKGMFDCCGVTVQIDEEYINTVTAISGSAPAYVMRFADDFISFAKSQGIDKESAHTLVLQAFKGTIEMIHKSPETIDTLIKNVTSPNGTTEAGLKSMDTSDFERVVCDFLNATVKRADELTK